MAEFAELLRQAKTNVAPPVEPPPQQETFKGRLEQRKLEQEQRELGREQFEEQPSLGARIGEAFTGKQRQTEETRTLPEFREIELSELVTPERSVGRQLKLTAGLLSTFNTNDQMDVIKEAIPDAKFTQDSKGNIIVETSKGKSLLNAPGLSGQDAIRALTGVLSFAPASKIAQASKTALGRFLLGGGGAAATQAGLQEVAARTGAEEARRPGEVLEAGVLGGVTEAAIPALRQLGARRQAGRIGAVAEEVPVAAENIQAAREATEATGIPLFQAQQTGIPSQLERQSFVAQLPAGTQKSVTALRTQNEAAAEAVTNFLDEIAPSEAIVTGAKRFRTASQKAVDAQKAIRKEKTSPLFTEAFKNTDPIDITSVRDLIKQKKLDFPSGGEVNRTLNKISGLIKGKPNLRKLQNAKLEIDQLISKFGENSLGNTTKREVLEVKNALLEQMDNVSPEYRIAREAFIAESPAVNAIEDSIIGKVSAFDDNNLKRISRTIFDPAETNPKIITDAKDTIQKQDPDAWNELLRVELERRIGSIPSDIAEGGIGAIENVPRQLERAIFGNPKQRQILFRAVDGETKKNLTFLETALKRAKLGRPGGSQTAIRSEIQKEFSKGIPGKIRDFFKSPGRAIGEVGEETARNRKIRATAEALFNPQYADEMARLRRIDPNSEVAGTAFDGLIKRIEQALPAIQITRQSDSE